MVEDDRLFKRVLEEQLGVVLEPDSDFVLELLVDGFEL